MARQGQMLAAQLASTLEYALSAGAVDQIPSTIEATVKVELESQHPEWVATIRLEVQDSGRGIARNKLVTIFEHFEPFEQVDG